MLNLSKITALFFCAVLFGSFFVLAQAADLEVIKPEFQEMDINKDGFVTSDEIQAYQAKKFEELDKDSNGAIDSGELAADKTKMFASADKDKNGKITKEEAGSQFSEYFKQMDKNKDEKVSEAEYTDYWKGIYYF